MLPKEQLTMQAREILTSVFGADDTQLSAAASLQDLGLDSIRFSILVFKVEAVLAVRLESEQLAPLMLLNRPLVQNLADLMNATLHVRECDDRQCSSSADSGRLGRRMDSD